MQKRLREYRSNFDRRCRREICGCLDPQRQRIAYSCFIVLCYASFADSFSLQDPSKRPKIRHPTASTIVTPRGRVRGEKLLRRMLRDRRGGLLSSKRQSMDHELGVNYRHLVDAVGKHVLEFLDDLYNLSPCAIGDLLADSNCLAPFLINAHLLVCICWSRPLIPLRVLGHIELHDGEKIFGFRVLCLSDYFFISALKAFDVAFPGRPLVPEHSGREKTTEIEDDKLDLKASEDVGVEIASALLAEIDRGSSGFNTSGLIVCSLCSVSIRCFENLCGGSFSLWNTSVEAHKRLSGC
ncbi:hypothetical protein BVRB_7g165690 [Beta vulgaris subsp. vulgaris]|nr:hypothetical protein BVRB_7g165690 [Beta vulgaris subsp. vulgaris]